MPFAGYKDFEHCLRENQDKRDPKAYCGYIKHKTEDYSKGIDWDKIEQFKRGIGRYINDADAIAKYTTKSLTGSPATRREIKRISQYYLNRIGIMNVGDITYVKGYFKTGADIKTPNVNCMRDHLNKTLEQTPDIDLETALQNAQNFCISETDFGDIDLDEYMLLRNISIKLSENKMDFYIINDAEVMSQITPGKSLRVEPMKTLAEASTGGKKSSSNIEKVGYFNNMLEVEFQSGESYIYFVEPDFYDRFVEAPSKGKFLWEELRGKKTGLVWGYATGTGSKMTHTPGGVGGSIVSYAKGTSGAPDYEPRLPTERERALIQKEIQIQFLGEGLKYKKHDPDLKRQETLHEIRSMLAQPGIKKKDFEGIPIITDKVNNLEDFGVCQKSYKLQYDFYHTEDEKERNKLQKTIKKYNINIKEDTTLRGVITRAGAFDYGGKIVYKDWNNILENAANQPILPVFGSKYTNPHKEENIPHLIGYVNNWGIDNPKEEWLYGDVHTFEPIAEISDLPKPKDIQVSLSMFDDSNEDDKFQHIVGFRNVAIALNNQLEGRCDSVDGYGSCIISPIGDLNNHANLSKLDKSSDKRPSESSSLLKRTRKIIKKKSDLHMPDENKVKEDIAKFIEDFKAKQKEDAGSIVTGNEVAGHTLHDEFIRTMLDEGFSPAAAESAWEKYNAQGKEAGANIEINTGGFVKTPAGIGDFEDKLKTLGDTVEKQEKAIKKYEDFFKVEQLKKEAELKSKYKKPISEEKQDLIDKMDYETLEKVKPILDLYIEEHPEILPVEESVDKVGDMNTNEILKLLGKSKDESRKIKSDMEKMKEEAEAAMEAKWGKK